MTAPHGRPVERSMKLRTPGAGLSAMQHHLLGPSRPDARVVPQVRRFSVAQILKNLINRRRKVQRTALWDRTRRLIGGRSPPRGLLPRASLELDEPLSWHPALRVSSDADQKTSGRMVSPALLRPAGARHRLVGAGFTGFTAPNISNAKSRFPCWL